jgi:hypothetical protein
MATGTFSVPQQRVFRVFISYASEDLAIATAAAVCLKTALPDFFAEVNFDKEFDFFAEVNFDKEFLESFVDKFRGQSGVDPSVETASKRDSCGWLLRTLQQQG